MKNIVSLLFLLLLAAGQAGASELFLRIVPGGTYEVKVDDELQVSSKNKFRFFELSPGWVSIRIKDTRNNSIVYNGSIQMLSGRRVVAGLYNGTLSTLETVQVSGDCEFPGNGSYSNYHGYPQPCSESAFAELVEILKKERIDSSLIEKAKHYVPRANLSSSQVKQICDLLSFDSSKLDFARYAYDYVVDPGSYFIVNKTFKFSSSGDELDRYVKNR